MISTRSLNVSIEKFKLSIARTLSVIIIVEIIKVYFIRSISEKSLEWIYSGIGDQKLNILPFNNVWLVTSICAVIGFGVNDFFSYKFTNNLSNEYSDSQKTAIVDLNRFSTMFIVKSLLLSYYLHGNFKNIDMSQISLALIGFVIFDLYILKHLPVIKNQPWMIDYFKTVSVIIIADLIPDLLIEPSSLPLIFASSFAIPFFYKVIKKKLNLIKLTGKFFII